MHVKMFKITIKKKTLRLNFQKVRVRKRKMGGGTKVQSRKHGFDPWSGRSPGEENGNPLQYSCLQNPMDRGAWWATVHRVTKESDVTERLSTHDSST